MQHKTHTKLFLVAFGLASLFGLYTSYYLRELLFWPFTLSNIRYCRHLETMSNIVELLILHINHENLEVDDKVVYYLVIDKMAKF